MNEKTISRRKEFLEKHNFCLDICIFGWYLRKSNQKISTFFSVCSYVISEGFAAYTWISQCMCESFFCKNRNHALVSTRRCLYFFSCIFLVDFWSHSVLALMSNWWAYGICNSSIHSPSPRSSKFTFFICVVVQNSNRSSSRILLMRVTSVCLLHCFVHCIRKYFSFSC